MNPEEPVGLALLESQEDLRLLMDGWIENLVQVLESMTSERPQASWRVIHDSTAEAPTAALTGADILWWEQPLQFPSEAVIWVASPRASWEYAGNLTLKAAGREDAPEADAHKAWLEILSQWLLTLARSVGNLLEREVTCATGSEKAPSASSKERVEVSLAFGDTALAPLAVSFSATLEALLAAAVDPRQPRQASETADEDRSLDKTPANPPSRTLDLLLDVELPVSISFGKTQLPLKDLLKLTTGSIVELNRGVNEPVEILVNHYLVARGEVVVVEGNYGVRIQHIISRQDRIRSLRY